MSARFLASLLMLLLAAPVAHANRLASCARRLVAALTFVTDDRESSGFGDLSRQDVRRIQAQVNASGIPTLVFGSAARGQRRFIHDRTRTIGKRADQRSDIDYFVPSEWMLAQAGDDLVHEALLMDTIELHLGRLPDSGSILVDLFVFPALSKDLRATPLGRRATARWIPDNEPVILFRPHAVAPIFYEDGLVPSFAELSLRPSSSRRP